MQNFRHIKRNRILFLVKMLFMNYKEYIPFIAITEYTYNTIQYYRKDVTKCLQVPLDYHKPPWPHTQSSP